MTPQSQVVMAVFTIEMDHTWTSAGMSLGAAPERFSIVSLTRAGKNRCGQVSLAALKRTGKARAGQAGQATNGSSDDAS